MSKNLSTHTPRKRASKQDDPAPDARESRLSAALRDNLKKRKAAQKKRRDVGKDDENDQQNPQE